MTAATESISSAGSFAPQELAALRVMRTRYAIHSDVFDDRALAHLRFLRWLYHNGRLVP